MAAFHYRALDAHGKSVKGIAEGDSARQVRAQLRQQHLKPMTVSAASEKKRANKTRPLLRRRISHADLVLITRQLATLLNASMPLAEALTAAVQQARKPRIKTLLLHVRARVLEGHSLAYALGDFPYIFDDMYRAMIKAGERAGFLGQVLTRLADYTEERQHTQQDLSSAMIYPILLILIATTVVGLLMVFVVPQLVSLFAHSDAELPLLTQWVMAISDTVSRFWWLMGLVIVALWWTGKTLLRQPERRRRWHRLLLKLPYISRLITTMDAARFASTLSILASSGVPLLEGLRIASYVLNNLALRAASQQAADAVQEGSSLYKALDRTGVFPPMMVHMVASGEASGQLEAMLARCAQNQERELKQELATLMRLLEPLMIIVMAAVVCAIVFAVLLPIIEMNSLVT